MELQWLAILMLISTLSATVAEITVLGGSTQPPYWVALSASIITTSYLVHITSTTVVPGGCLSPPIPSPPARHRISTRTHPPSCTDGRSTVVSLQQAPTEVIFKQGIGRTRDVQLAMSHQLVHFMPAVLCIATPISLAIRVGIPRMPPATTTPKLANWI